MVEIFGTSLYGFAKEKCAEQGITRDFGEEYQSCISFVIDEEKNRIKNERRTMRNQSLVLKKLLEVERPNWMAVQRISVDLHAVSCMHNDRYRDAASNSLCATSENIYYIASGQTPIIGGFVDESRLGEGTRMRLAKDLASITLAYANDFESEKRWD